MAGKLGAFFSFEAARNAASLRERSASTAQA
jgi:hypothetical protein